VFVHSSVQVVSHCLVIDNKVAEIVDVKHSHYLIDVELNIALSLL